MTEPNNTERPPSQVVPPEGAVPYPVKKPRSDFRKAMVITMAPFLLFSVALVITNLFPNIRLWGGFNVGLPAAIALSIIFAVIFAVTRRAEWAAGVLAGLGIGIVALGASCFATFFL